METEDDQRNQSKKVKRLGIFILNPQAFVGRLPLWDHLMFSVQPLCSPAEAPAANRG